MFMWKTLNGKKTTGVLKLQAITMSREYTTTRKHRGNDLVLPSSPDNGYNRKITLYIALSLSLSLYCYNSGTNDNNEAHIKCLP